MSTRQLSLSPSRSLRIVTLAGTLAGLLASRGALAQMPPADSATRAKQEFEDGQHHYDVRRRLRAERSSYGSARTSTIPDPILLFNIAQAERLAGDCKAALVTYERYESVSKNGTRTAPSSTTRRRRSARAALAAAKPETEAEDPNPEPVKPVEPAPRPSPDTSGNMQSSLDSQPTTTGVAAVLPPPPPPQHSSLPTAGIVVGAAGVVLVGTSILFGQLAGNDAKAVSGATLWNGALASTQSAGKTDSAVAIATGIGGGVALAAGIAMYILGGREHHIQVAVTPTSAGVTWRSGF